MKKFKRMFVIVLDSLGIGEMDDAADFDDIGCDTLGHISQAIDSFHIPNLQKMGLANLHPLEPIDTPIGSYMVLKEKSKGKDTITGHWEMMGIETLSYPTTALCLLGHISRAAYYKWLRHKKGNRELENERIAREIIKIYECHPDMGYRRIRDELVRHHGLQVNDKRIMHFLGIKSSIKHRGGCTRREVRLRYNAENILGWNFEIGVSTSKMGD